MESNSIAWFWLKKFPKWKEYLDEDQLILELVDGNSKSISVSSIMFNMPKC